MKMMTYAEGIREGMSIRMREDPNVILFGEDVGAFGGCFGVSMGMIDEFGPERVRDTPISEGAIIGCAVGAAATGLRPIAELMFCDFLTVGMDQLVNQAAKMRYMFGGKISMPMVVRLPAGAGTGAAAQHSQSLEAWLTHVPGLKVVYPSCAEDALGLMLSAIDDDNPVMYFENKALLGMKSEVNSFDPIPLGKGKILREGERPLHHHLRQAGVRRAGGRGKAGAGRRQRRGHRPAQPLPAGQGPHRRDREQDAQGRRHHRGGAAAAASAASSAPSSARSISTTWTRPWCASARWTRPSPSPPTWSSTTCRTPRTSWPA